MRYQKNSIGKLLEFKHNLWFSKPQIQFDKSIWGFFCNNFTSLFRMDISSIASWSWFLLVAKFTFMSMISFMRLWTSFTSVILIKVSWFNNILRTSVFVTTVSLLNVVFCVFPSGKRDEQLDGIAHTNPKTKSDNMVECCTT